MRAPRQQLGGTRRERLGADAVGGVPRFEALRFCAVPMTASDATSSPVSRMLTCRALIAMLVVAGDSGHELLSLGTRFVLCFLLEVLCIVASKC